MCSFFLNPIQLQEGKEQFLMAINNGMDREDQFE